VWSGATLVTTIGVAEVDDDVDEEEPGAGDEVAGVAADEGDADDGDDDDDEAEFAAL